jgi:hypothetical protein
MNTLQGLNRHWGVQWDILSMVITWISWGAAPGCINLAPLGLFKVIFVYQKVQFVPFLSIILTKVIRQSTDNQ